MQHEEKVGIQHIVSYTPDESTRHTQNFGLYLNDLKGRLKELRQQHDDVIQQSVDLIREINDVSTSLTIVPKANDNQSSTKIKRLIMEFEANNSTPTTKDSTLKQGCTEIQQLLQNFEKLNKSHVLRESMLYFKKAKESFEQIDIFIESINSYDDISQPTSPVIDEIAKSGSLQEKINMFNKAAEPNNNYTHFSSCYSSATSIDDYRSLESIEVIAENSTTNSMGQSGYEGDVDSEMDPNECDN